MNSRNNILKAIASAGYPEVTKPKYPLQAMDYKNIADIFINVSQRIGSDTIIVNSYDQAKDYFRKIQDTFQAINGDFKLEETSDDLLLLESRLAVAENGGIWLDEYEMKHRVSPFACNHLFVIVDAQNIVATMHDAYFQLNILYPPQAFPGFGVFIAGPSKTADIEQTLVIGAQGAKKHTIILITA